MQTGHTIYIASYNNISTVYDEIENSCNTYEHIQNDT